MNKLINKYGFVLIPLGLFVGIYFVILKWPFNFLPDYFKINEYSKIYEILNLIISSLVSLIGIYISVSLVAHEYFKQKTGIDFHKSFLLNSTNAYYISFTVYTILYTFLLSICLPYTNLNPYNIGHIYFSILLFILLILSLFFVAFNLFSSLKPENIFNQEIKNITKDAFIFDISEKSMDEQAIILENNPITKTETIILALISVSDNIKAQVIIHKFSDKVTLLITEIENKHQRELIIHKLISFYIKIIDYSLTQPNNYAILRSIWIAVANIYISLIELKKPATYFEKLREVFFDRYFNRLIENNKEEIVFEGITTIGQIIEKQVLYNTADESKIHYLTSLIIDTENKQIKTTEYDHNAGQQWQEVAIEFMQSFSTLINKCIKLNKPDIINKCFEVINKITFNLHLKKTPLSKESFFYINSINITCDYAYKAFSKNVFNEGHEASNITPSLFSNLIHEEHPVARTILTKYCYFLIELQKIGKLDRWFLGGLQIGEYITTEGELGGIAKQCAINYKKGGIIKDCLLDCIKTFEILKEYYEINPPSIKGHYTVIKWQLENIKKWLSKSNVVDEELTNNLNKLINSFQE